ncbi:MAG TPA: GDSL-type esterase/lipase family protein [Solirubrobacteraceae bacterium]|nr:GDSL-type esterase/lipase family protein [Solirubrobacteraceae bacterium]
MSLPAARRLPAVAALGLLLALAGAPASAAQSPAPSLFVIGATLRQADERLRFGLRFNRALHARELQPRRGRLVCVLLSPQRPSRRRACVSRRGGRLQATIAPVDEHGAAVGPARPLRGAKVVVRGAFMMLRAPAGALRVRLGDTVSWRALVQWRDGSGCAVVPDPSRCMQLMPAGAPLTLATRRARRPAFARLHRLRLLATGDSMIQIIDSHLKQRLGRRRGTTVHSDAHVSTGISKPAMLDWVRKARGQAVAYKPDVTVMFLGANDGFAIAGARCCEDSWVAAYARRVETMMRSYLRGGRSYVYWLTLPTPRRAEFVRIYSRVNVAIKRAAERVGAGARVIDVARVFTPGGRFRQRITFRGRTIDARQADGVHLSTAGASVVATLIIDRLRADRALR